MALDFSKSQPGDHAPAECAEARRASDAAEARLRAVNYFDAGYAAVKAERDAIGHAGYHAGYGICAGTVAPYNVSPFVQRALAGALPAKITR